MTALASLHGPVALVLLCSLLFVEEAGVPLPFFPGDAILIVGGFLIGHGSLSPWIFIPLACLATFGGAMTAYLWARALGQRALEAVADRLYAGRALSRATARVQEDGPAGIAVCRLLPGLRVYTTMVASGLAEISENFPQVVDPDGLVAGSVMTAILVLGYIAATRLGAGGTAGEALLNVTYHPSSTRS